jgi:hypothetical protein
MQTSWIRKVTEVLTRKISTAGSAFFWSYSETVLRSCNRQQLFQMFIDRLGHLKHVHLFPAEPEQAKLGGQTTIEMFRSH